MHAVKKIEAQRKREGEDGMNEDCERRMGKERGGRIPFFPPLWAFLKVPYCAIKLNNIK